MSNSDFFPPVPPPNEVLSAHPSLPDNGQSTAAELDNVAVEMAIAAAWEANDRVQGQADSPVTTDQEERGADLDDTNHQTEQWENAASPLTPPFLRSHQALQAQVTQLTAQLAAANQQLLAYQRRADSTEALIHQQARELSQTQAQLSHTVAELQVHQEEAKRQQLQVETLTSQRLTQADQIKHLTEQLVQSQSELARRDVEPSETITADQPTQETLVNQHVAHISQLERSVDELRSRLQRQQRYTLQYKSALEQCVAQPDFRPSSDIRQVVARLTGQNTDSQPWASVGDILAAFPSSQATSPWQSSQGSSQPENRSEVSPPHPLPQKLSERPPATRHTPTKQDPDRLVELPNFLSRAVSLSR
ncbi:MAG: hypothetical protein RLZZ568_2332 [Cyanobacteriota bacterium]